MKSVGRGTPLVAVHGGPGASHDYLLPNLYRLATSYRLVFIDERGSGRSPRLEDTKQYTVEKMADDVEAVRAALQLGKIALLGHSYGGVVVQAYAFKYPSNLSHLILASTFSSTRQLNDALGRLKQACRRRGARGWRRCEKVGLFGKGETWEHGRYSDEYAKLAWGVGDFPSLYGARPDATRPARGEHQELLGALSRDVGLPRRVRRRRQPERGRVGGPPVGDQGADADPLGDHDESDPVMSREMNAEDFRVEPVASPSPGT